jgi:hypothetical protein
LLISHLVLKICIEDISCLQVVSIVNQNFSSAGWAEHSTVRGVNQTIKLVNLNSILVSLVILIVPVVGTSLDILPLDVNLSSGGWIILLSISGVDHSIKLTDLKYFSLLGSFLFIVISLEQLIIHLFVIKEIYVLSVPLKKVHSSQGHVDWLSAESLLVSLNIEVVEVNFLVSSWVESSVPDVVESVELGRLWNVESVLLELRVVVLPVVIVQILGLKVCFIPINRVLVDSSGLHDVLRSHSQL